VDVAILPRQRHTDFTLHAEAGDSGLTVIPMRIRFGAAQLDCGGIAGVHTAEGARRRGLARRVIGAALDWMLQQHLAISWLFGIPDFYDQFGFAVTGPEVVTTFRAAGLATLPAAEVQRGTPVVHRAACVDLFTTRDRGSFGGGVRDPATWPWFRRGTRWKGPFGLRMAEAAYALVDEPEVREEGAPLRVGEICGRGAALCGLLGALGREALAAGLGEVAVHAPSGGELGALTRRMGGQVATHWPHSGGPMARIIDWPRCIEQLAPLWAAQPEVRLTLATELGGVRLDGGRAEPTAADPDLRLPQGLLIQGLVGYLGGEDLLADPRTQILRPPAAEALIRLLPRRHPYYWEPDKF